MCFLTEYPLLGGYYLSIYLMERIAIEAGCFGLRIFAKPMKIALLSLYTSCMFML